MVVPSFVLGDPWTTLMKGAVSFWTFFSVEAALASLNSHLEEWTPYREVDVMLLQHGVPRAGIAPRTPGYTSRASTAPKPGW